MVVSLLFPDIAAQKGEPLDELLESQSVSHNQFGGHGSGVNQVSGCGKRAEGIDRALYAQAFVRYAVHVEITGKLAQPHCQKLPAAREQRNRFSAKNTGCIDHEIEHSSVR